MNQNFGLFFFFFSIDRMCDSEQRIYIRYNNEVHVGLCVMNESG